MKVFVAVIFACFAVASGQLKSCPPSEDIKPCTCKIGIDKRPYAACENVKSADQLVKVVKNMGNISFTTFNVEKSNLGVLPSHVFDGLQIETLSIMNCNLTRLSEDRNRPPFLGLENSLEYLEIKSSFAKNTPLTYLSLSHLKKLLFIQLDGNTIPSIGNNWFESGPYGLKDLHLLNTSLTSLGSHAFEALERLEYIYVNGGSLKEIARSMFPMPATYLRSIDLSENRLDTLPADLFTKMPSLDQVFLDHNAFTTISELVFAPVWNQLEYVYMYGNPIRCDSNLKWIYQYRLPAHLDGYCTYPLRLFNKKLQNITLSDLE